MYRKVLIPLDGSHDAEGVFSLDGVFPILDRELAPDGEVILLMVIPPPKTDTVDGRVLQSTIQEEIARAEAMDYLHELALQLGDGSDRWRCEVITYNSVVDGIIDFAEGEGVDLIAFCTHGHNPSLRLVKECMARTICRMTKIKLHVYGPRELAGVA